MRASFSSVSPPVTLTRSSQYSSSGYEPLNTSKGRSCIVRTLRVWRLLPPRKCFGAASTISTARPRARALSAAQSAALPPPTTSRSYERDGSMFPLGRYRIDDRRCVKLHGYTAPTRKRIDERLPARLAHRDAVGGRGNRCRAEFPQSRRHADR